MSESNNCRCGCGETVKAGSLYRPGHDARHAGRVGRMLVADERDMLTRREFDLMSPALQAKVQRVVANQTKDARPVRWPQTGTVKVGRWEYPARSMDNGTIERNTARDGSGEWIKVHPSAFSPTN
jgi:hypothetical protein